MNTTHHNNLTDEEFIRMHMDSDNDLLRQACARLEAKLGDDEARDVVQELRGAVSNAARLADDLLELV